MGLNSFYNSGSDEELLKSLDGDSVHADQEELAKAMNKAGLVQKEVQVKGKNGQMFTRKQWVKASEDQPQNQTFSQHKYTKDDKDNAFRKYSKMLLKYADKGSNATMNDVSDVIGEVETLYKNGGVYKKDYEILSKYMAMAQRAAKERIKSQSLTSSQTKISVKPDSAGRFKPSDFQFRAGGQDVTDIVNAADKKFGVKNHSNGNVGFGTLTLSNNEKVGFGYDNTGAYLQWQGQKFRSADELDTKWSGTRSITAGNNDKSNAQQQSVQKLSKDEAKKKTQSITSSIGKDDKSRNDFMAKAKAQGVTWKENDHVGINWMRCCMAMNKHFENGGSFDNINTQLSSNASKDANAKSAKYSKKTGKVLEDFGKSKQQFDSLEQFVGSDMFKQTKKLYTRLDEIDHEAEQSLGSDDEIKEYKKEFNAIKKEFNSVRKLYEELCMRLPGGNWSKLPSGSPERRKAIDEYDTTKKLRDRAEKVLFPQYSEISYFGNGI